MKRYRFRLEPVLQVRRREQDTARGALLTATAEVAAQERALEDRNRAYTARLARPVPTEAAGFRLELSRRTALGDAVCEQRGRLEAARAQQVEAREAWAIAAARVGALERLDERQRAEHRVAENREHDRSTDELVVTRHGRGDR